MKFRGNTRKPQQLSSVCQDRSKTECIACGTLHQVGECPATSLVCFKCNKKGHFPDYVGLLPQCNRVLIGMQGDHDMVEVEVVTEVEKAMDPNVLCVKQRLQTLQNL